MSNKVISKGLLNKNTATSQYQLISNCNGLFGTYQTDLDKNMRIIMDKYCYLNERKVRDLLQELDNNCELAMQILEEEQQHCSKIVQEKKREEKKVSSLSIEQQNRFLKKAYLNLYKKLLAKTQQFQQIQCKYQSSTLENRKLKQFNRLLLQKEYNNLTVEDNTPIC